MDIAANTIQTLGFAGQIFTGCLNGFQAWQTASDLSRDAIELQIKLEWTRSRLDMWGTLWGLEQQDHLKDSRFRHFGMMALNHLVYINYCLEEFKSMDDIFPTLGDAGMYASTPAFSLARLSQSGGVTPDEMDALRYKLEHLQTNAGAKERAKWALQEGRALKMVETVKAMVEDLYTQFPPPASSEPNPIIKNSYLISDSLDNLDAVSESSTADTTLAALCAVKAERIRTGLEKRTDKLKSHDPYMIAGQLTQEREVTEGRWLGSFRQDNVSYRVPVLIEYKRMPRLVMATSSLDIRIQNVARLLSMKNKPAELRTLNCIGVMVARNNETVYRFVHELKAKNVFTLTHLLKTPTRENVAGSHRDKWALDQKFALAKQLTRAVLYLHLAGWLHKGIRSNNIVFCAGDESDVDLSEPYIVGFEYSRVDLARLETETVDQTDDTDDAFRHPDTQGPPTERAEFQRIFDVYSLGMVLLDIGSKRSVGNLRVKFAAQNATRGGWAAAAFRKWLLETAIDSDVTGLAARMGSVYVEVVKACLSGKFTERYKNDVSVGLYVNVLRRLQQCNV